MKSDIWIPPEVASELRYYVYALRDPRDSRVFYIGKGKGSRIASHVVEAGKDRESERAKLRMINGIEESGADVDLLFLRTGIDDEETAFAIEQAVIDAFAADRHQLTNLVRGHYSGVSGLATLPAVVARYHAHPCPPIDAPVIMVKVQKGWRSDSSEHEIYEMTRGHWKISSGVRHRARYCLGIAFGVVRGAYLIEDWFPSTQPWDLGKNRWGFVGKPAAEIAHVVGTEVRDAFPNQVMYRQFMSGYNPKATR